MKTIKEYKGVALIYLGLALINVVWMINVENPVNKEKVRTLLCKYKFLKISNTSV